jgi:hypothetical protein
MQMRESKVVQAIGAVLWIYVAYIGASWCWSGISILVGNVSGACEAIPLYLLGTGIGPELGDCLAKGDESSWGISGGIVGLFVVLVGVGILTALLVLPGVIARRRGLRTT